MVSSSTLVAGSSTSVITMNKKEQDKFNAEKFVEILLVEGSKAPCDESVESFHGNENLPPFYDDALFKRGQKFFYHHIFALFYGKFLGLLSVLAIPSIVQILIHTKMSGSPMTAYKRYLATIFHMCVWYESDFTPGSKLWQSVFEVKSKHNSVSKRCCTNGLHRINQKDMALTQFGFMGYALARREKIGLHYIKDEDWQAFIHIWRVVGYIMGIEDRFNICRESVQETKEICEVLADQVFKPALERKDKDFIRMASYLTEGMWAMNPSLNPKIYLNLLYNVLQNDIEFKEYIPLNVYQRMMINVLVLVITSLQFKISRVYHNFLQHLTLWLMRVFPFLAYYKYGYANSHVTLSFEQDTKTR